MVLHMIVIIKELAKKFECQFKCLGEKIKHYITFSVRIKKELDNGKRICIQSIVY